MGDVSEKASSGPQPKRPRIELQSSTSSKDATDGISHSKASAAPAPLPAKLTEFLADFSRNLPQQQFSLQSPTASNAPKDLIPETRPVPPGGRVSSSGNESKMFQRKVVKVQNLPTDVEDADLVKALQHQCYFGNISYVELLRESHSAYVEFENGDAAAKCLRFASNKNNAVTINGRVVQILATNKSGLVRRSVLESEDPTSVLYLRVSNLAAEKLNVRHVHGICAEAGLTESLQRIAVDHIASQLDEVFIEFSSISEAVRAKFVLNAMDIFPDHPAEHRCTIIAEFANMAEVDIPQIDDDHFDFTSVPPLEAPLPENSSAEAFMTMEQVSDDDDDVEAALDAFRPKLSVEPSKQTRAPEATAVLLSGAAVAEVRSLTAEAAVEPQKTTASKALVKSPKLSKRSVALANADTHSKSSGSSKDGNGHSSLKTTQRDMERPVWPKRKFGEVGRGHVTDSSRRQSNPPISERQLHSPGASWAHCKPSDRTGFPRAQRWETAFAVLEVGGIDARRINCDHLCKLFGLYGNVCKIIFHLPKPGSNLNNAKVQMSDIASANRVVEYLDNVEIFHTPLHIRKSSRVNFVRLPNNAPKSLPDIDHSPTFVDYTESPLNRFPGRNPGSADSFSFPESSLYFVAPKGISEEQIRTLLRTLDTSSPLRVEFLSQMALPSKQRSLFVAGKLEFRTKNKAIDTLVLAHGATIMGSDGQSYTLRLSFLGDKRDKFDFRVRLSPQKISSGGDSNDKLDSVVEKALAYSGT